MLRSVFVIFVYQLIGEILQKYFALTIPGPVIGLVLLLSCLLLLDRYASGSVAGFKQDMADTTRTLLAHLPLLFVPIGVGVVMHVSSLESQLLAVLGVIFAGTVLTVGFSAVLMEKLQNRANRDER